MMFKPVTLIHLFLFLFPFFASAQNQTDAVAPQSRLVRFAETGTADPDRVALNVIIRDQEVGEPVLGATVLLLRQNPEQVHGKISQWDGRCKFKVAPGTYNFRVQLTGMITYEKLDIELLAGRQYDMEIDMARLGQPVASPKQQAGKN